MSTPIESDQPPAPKKRGRPIGTTKGEKARVNVWVRPETETWLRGKGKIGPAIDALVAAEMEGTKKKERK